jgi:hypothetical protein
MSITVKTLKGETHSVPFSADENITVSVFKDRLIALISGQVIKENVNLIYQGKMLKNEDVMPEIPSGGFLVLMISQKKIPQLLTKTNTSTSASTSSTPSTQPSTSSTRSSTTTTNRSQSSSGNVSGTGSSGSGSGSSSGTGAYNDNTFASMFGNSDPISTGRAPVSYLTSQNDLHVANAYAEIFNDNTQSTNLIRNTNYFKNLSQSDQTQLIDDLENNVMPDNIKNVIKYLIDEHASYTNSSPQMNSAAINSIMQLLGALGQGNVIPLGMGGLSNTAPEQKQKDIEEIKTILGGQFTDEEIERAYAMCGNDVNAAINYLLSMN